MKGAIADYPLSGKLLILLGLFLVGETVFSFAALYLTDLLFPAANVLQLVQEIDLFESADQFNSMQVTALKIIQLLSSLGRFVLMPFIFLYLVNASLITSTGLNIHVNARQIFLIVLIMFSATGVIGFIYEWNQHIQLPAAMEEMEKRLHQLEAQAQLQTDAFLNTTTIGGLLLNIFIIGIVASVGEEILFRGVLQQTVFTHTQKMHMAVWSAAFIFSFIHLQFYGFFPRLVLGAIVGYLYAWSGSLWAAIIAHFVNNTGAVIAYYLLNKGIISEQVAEPTGWVQAIISLPLLLFFIFLYNRSVHNGAGLDKSFYHHHTAQSV
ncbi:MAG: lysostaphin resistance A-like protein, partial [Chitinophagales bacterium]